MKRYILFAFLTLFVAQYARPAVAVSTHNQAETSIAAVGVAKPAQTEKAARKASKLEKKLDKLQHRIEKLQRKAADVWGNGKFRLGAILLAVAVALALVSVIISIGGLIDFIAGLLALGGVVLIIWGLVETFG